MKRQMGPANSIRNRFAPNFTRSEVLDFAHFRPKIGFSRVVSTHPLTLRKPDKSRIRFT